VVSLGLKQPTVTDSLFVPVVRLSTVGRRAFPVAGARIWYDFSQTLAYLLTVAVHI